MLPWLRLPFDRGPSLRHGRVLLRPPRPADWREWCRLREQSRDFLTPWEPTWPADAVTRAAFRRRLRQHLVEMQDGQGYSFLIFRKGDRALLGGVSISNVRRGVAQTASLGYWIGAPYARQGYMSEALTGVLEFAFTSLSLHRVEAACLPGNTASKALLRKVGFTEEGYAREYLRINGAWRDHVLFAVLRGDAWGLDDARARPGPPQPR